MKVKTCDFQISLLDFRLIFLTVNIPREMHSECEQSYRLF